MERTHANIAEYFYDPEHMAWQPGAQRARVVVYAINATNNSSYDLHKKNRIIPQFFRIHRVSCCSNNVRVVNARNRIRSGRVSSRHRSRPLWSANAAFPAPFGFCITITAVAGDFRDEN